MFSRLATCAAAAVLATTVLSLTQSLPSSAASPSATLGVVMGGFDDPAGLAMDPNGNVWVANNQAGTVQEVPKGVTLESQLPPAVGGLDYPAGVAIDAGGDVFVSEQGATTVEELPAGGGSPITFHGFHQPAEITIDPFGNAWVANSAADTIQEIPSGATGSTVLPAPVGGMNHPNGIVSDPGGNLWVTNTGGSTIQEVPVGSPAILPAPIPGFAGPYGITLDESGNLWVTNAGNNTVQEVPAGATSATALPAPISGFDLPTDITLAPNGDLWVSNTAGDTIQVVPDSSTSSSVLPAPVGGFNGPFGVVFTSTCSAWVSNVGNSFNGTGTSIQQVDAPLGCPSAPQGVAVTPGNGEATVSWDASTSPAGDAVSGYDVTSVPGGYTCSVAATPTPSCVVTGLTNGVSYTFDVVAIDAVGDSGVGASPPASPTSDVLAAPTFVSSSVGNGTVSVTWSAPPTPPAILYYVATASASNEATEGTILGSSATTATFASLANGAQYAISVVAVDASGDGNPLTVTLEPMSVPGRVRAVDVTGAKGAIVVTWSMPSSDGGSPVTGYDVFVWRSAEPRVEHLVGASTRRFVATGLRSATRYFVLVRAVNAVGKGQSSALASAIDR